MNNDHITAEHLNGGAPTNGRRSVGQEATALAWTGMPEPDFAIALERDESGAAALVLSGELDLYRAPEVERGLAELVGPERGAALGEAAVGGHSSGGDQAAHVGRGSLVVDLCSVTFIDSTTLALLLAASRRQQARGGELLLLVGPRTPMTAFRATGFDRLLAIRVVSEPSRTGAA